MRANTPASAITKQLTVLGFSLQPLLWGSNQLIALFAYVIFNSNISWRKRRCLRSASKFLLNITLFLQAGHCAHPVLIAQFVLFTSFQTFALRPVIYRLPIVLIFRALHGINADLPLILERY